MQDCLPTSSVVFSQYLWAVFIYLSYFFHFFVYLACTYRDMLKSSSRRDNELQLYHRHTRNSGKKHADVYLYVYDFFLFMYAIIWLLSMRLYSTIITITIISTIIILHRWTLRTVKIELIYDQITDESRGISIWISFLLETWKKLNILEHQVNIFREKIGNFFKWIFFFEDCESYSNILYVIFCLILAKVGLNLFTSLDEGKSHKEIPMRVTKN